MTTHVAFKMGFVVSALALGISGMKPAHALDSTNPQPAANAPQQEQVDREKASLKDKAQESIDAADANIDAFHRMATSADGAMQKQYKDIADDFSVLRGDLNDDLSKIDQASINDWSRVKPAVDGDISAANAALQRATAISHVQAPASKP
jgi:hypothetical protein